MLRGMKNLLAKGKVKIICEVHPAQLSSLGYNVKEISEFLSQYNYAVYLIEKEGKLRVIDRMSKDHHAHYLFTREEI